MQCKLVDSTVKSENKPQADEETNEQEDMDCSDIDVQDIKIEDEQFPKSSSERREPKTIAW